MNDKPRSPTATALLNLTGLGFGYARIGSRWLGLPYLAGTMGLTLVAIVTDAASHRALWVAIAVAWVGWMAFDGARVTRRRHPPAPFLGREGAVAVGALSLVAIGYAAYLMLGDLTFTAATAAEARGDCVTAIRHYDRVTGTFELTLSQDVVTAAANRARCAEFEMAAEQHGRGYFDNAAQRYLAHRGAHPGSPLAPFVDSNLDRVYLDWGRAAASAGKNDEAIRAYDRLLDETEDAGLITQAREALAAAHLTEAARHRGLFDPYTDGIAIGDLRTAMDHYQTVVNTFGDTAAAGAAPKEIAAVFLKAMRPIAEGNHCYALPALDYLITLTIDDVARDSLVAAVDSHARATHECGVHFYQEGDFESAVFYFEAVVDRHQNHAITPSSRSALIAARIAAADPSSAPPLPPPLGGGPAGTIQVIFVNPSPLHVTVMLSGPSAHEFEVPTCATCPATPGPPEQACAPAAGGTAVTLVLSPGDYHVLTLRTGGLAVPPTVGGFSLTRGPAVYCLAVVTPG